MYFYGFQTHSDYSDIVCIVSTINIYYNIIYIYIIYTTDCLHREYVPIQH
jgi:hypothetical protein